MTILRIPRREQPSCFLKIMTAGPVGFARNLRNDLRVPTSETLSERVARFVQQPLRAAGRQLNRVSPPCLRKPKPKRLLLSQ